MRYAENKVAAEELRRNEWAFWGVALAVLIFFAGSDAWWGNEAYFAEVVREMEQSGKWFYPTFNQEIVHNAPWLLLWEGWLAGKLFGISEWSLRGVAILNALALLAGTMLLARQFFNRRIALLSGVLLLGSCGFLYASRLFLGVIPAAACGIWALYLFVAPWQRMDFLRPAAVIFFLVLAVFLGSFYAALPPLGAGIVIGLTVKKEKQSKWMIALWSALGIVALAVCCWLRHFGVLPPEYPRFAEGFSRGVLRAIGFDAIRVFFPWSLWGIVAVAEIFFTFSRRESNFRSFAVATAVVWITCLFPSIENWRQMIHLLPMAAILTAASLAEERELNFPDRAADTVTRYLAIITGAFAVASVIWIPILQILFKISLSAYILWLMPVMGVTAQCLLLFDERAAQRCALPERCGGTVLAALTLAATALCFLRPNLAEFRSGRSFIQEELAVQLKNLPGKAMLYYGEQPDASLLYYGKVTAQFNATGKRDRQTLLREFLESNRERFVAVIANADEATQKEIAAIGNEFDLRWETPSARERIGTFSSAGKRLALYFGNVGAKAETESTSATEEKP